MAINANKEDLVKNKNHYCKNIRLWYLFKFIKKKVLSTCQANNIFKKYTIKKNYQIITYYIDTFKGIHEFSFTFGKSMEHILDGVWSFSHDFKTSQL